MTFLELCQEVARESGTVPGTGKPQTVSGNTNRLANIVSWTNEAYDRIQTESDNWRWLSAEFESPLISGAQRYTAVSLGISSRFSHWMPESEGRRSGFTIWNTTTGRVGEGDLAYLNWYDFRRTCLRGDPDDNAGTPSYFSIDDQDRLVFYPIPNDTFTITGQYYKAPQELTADDDVPEMPSRFHRAIKWRALVQLVVFDESPEQFSAWDQYEKKIMADLRRQQQPRFRVAGPLA